MFGEIIAVQLQNLGAEEPDALIKQAVLRFGMQRFEPLVRDPLTSGTAGMVSPTWTLGRDEMPELTNLATTKTCDHQASQLARSLAEAGVAVVSGLAAGIDTAALQGALSAGGRAVAVIGTWLRRS